MSLQSIFTFTARDKLKVKNLDADPWKRELSPGLDLTHSKETTLGSRAQNNEHPPRWPI